MSCSLSASIGRFTYLQKINCYGFQNHYGTVLGPPRAFTKANYHFDMRLAALSVVMLVTMANPSTGILITSGQADYAYENKTAKQVQPPPPPSPSVRTNAH